EPGFETEAIEVVGTAGNSDSIRDLEWLGEPFASRNDVELESVAALQATVDRSHEVAITLPAAREPGHVAQLILPEALSNLQRSDRLFGSRLPVHVEIGDV